MADEAASSYILRQLVAREDSYSHRPRYPARERFRRRKTVHPHSVQVMRCLCVRRQWIIL